MLSVSLLFSIYVIKIALLENVISFSVGKGASAVLERFLKKEQAPFPLIIYK